MQTSSLKRAIEKSGIKIDQRENQFWAIGEAYRVNWYDQEGRAICVQVRRHNDHNDSHTDYSAGFFADTIKLVIKYLTGK